MVSYAPQGQHLVHYPGVDGGGRKTMHHAACFVLCYGEPSRVADRTKALTSVSPKTGQQGPNALASERLGRGGHGAVYARGGKLPGVGDRFQEHSAVRVWWGSFRLDCERRIGGSHIYARGQERLPVVCFVYRQLANGLQQGNQDPGEARPHMLDYYHRTGKVFGKLGKHLSKSLRPAAARSYHGYPLGDADRLGIGA